MNQIIFEYIKQFNESENKVSNWNFNSFINKFKIIVIKKSDLQELEKVINSDTNNGPKIMLINIMNECNDPYFIVIYDHSIIFISKENIFLLSIVLDKHDDLIIISSSNNINSFLPQIVQSKIKNCTFFAEKDYLKTCKSFNQYFMHIVNKNPEIEKIQLLVHRTLTTFLMRKSYIRLEKERYNFSNIIKKIEINEKNYIVLDDLGDGYSSKVQLIYHLEEEHLFAIKKFVYAKEDKSFLREFNFYQKNFFYSIPHFYGKTIIDNYNCLIIEYIRGKTLSQIKNNELSYSDKLDITLQLMISIEFLHFYKYIYRDLKPNNILIDQHNFLILFDFDQVINIKETENNEIITTDFSSYYVCPELQNGSKKEYTFKEDIYSIGVLISKIIFLNESKNNNLIKYFSDCCKEKEPKNRPTITFLIDYFYNSFIYNKNYEYKNQYSYVGDDNGFYLQWMSFDFYFKSMSMGKINGIFDNDSDFEKCIEIIIKQINKIHILLQYKHVKQYSKKYIVQLELDQKKNHYLKCEENPINSNSFNHDDINISINSFPLDQVDTFQNIPFANNNIGVLYYNGIIVGRDINKSIHLFMHAAHQGNPDAQNNLGSIYYEGKYIARDIKKSIYYLTLAANQNHSEAQNKLGSIYYEGKYIERDIKKSIHYLTLAANQGHPDAQNKLGFIYLAGKYIACDISKSIYYLTLAADQNHSEAQNNLGSIYYEGKYINRDINKSIHYLTLAANQGHPVAQSSLGLIYYDGKYIARDIKKSIHYLTLAANQNHSISQINLGFIYYEGKYINRDINKSIYYYTLAANQNNQDAQNKLGLIYYEGKYINRDINKSIYYYTLAANQNHSIAQNNLGLIYYEGKYINRDINKSIYYYTLAANQNHLIAQNNLGLIYYEGKYINRDINKSIYCLTLAANQNNPNAQYNLGSIYYEGKYIARDIKKSIHYLILAANQNNPDAQNKLGSIYYEGKYINRDINKSIHYLTLAANQNNPNAQYNLGFIYYEGKYIARDIKKSIHYLILAANQNNPDAQNKLGFIYYEGEYINRDINKSIHYLTLAANQNNPNAQNNLGFIYYEAMIYRNEIGSIKKNLWYSIELLNEASIYDDGITIYNLLHIYFFEDINEENKLNKLYQKLIISSFEFSPSKKLLSLILIKKYKYIEYATIKNEISSSEYINNDEINQLSNEIYQYIKINNLEDTKNYEEECRKIKSIDYMINPIKFKNKRLMFNYITTKDFFAEKKVKVTTGKNINNDYYEGFGIYL